MERAYSRFGGNLVWPGNEANLAGINFSILKK